MAGPPMSMFSRISSSPTPFATVSRKGYRFTASSEIGEMPPASISARSDASAGRPRSPPWMRGWSVFTRPPRISGLPVCSETLRAGRPASLRAWRVPPVLRSWNPRSTRPRAKGTSPRLSETLRRAITGPVRGELETPGRNTARFQVSTNDGGPRVGGSTAPRRDSCRRRWWAIQRHFSLPVCLVLGGLAQLGQPARLDLPDALPGEVHDLPHLLEGDAALLGDVERAGVLELPDLLVGEVELDRPGLGVHVQVEVVLAGDEQARPWAVDAVGPGARPVLLDAPEQLLLFRVHLAGQTAAPELAGHLLAGHGLRAAALHRGRQRGLGLNGFRRPLGLGLTHRFPPPDRLTAELIAGGVTTDR